MPTLKHLASRVRISTKFGAPTNPNFRDADGWTVTLRYEGRQLTTPFYMGSALAREPDVLDVLDSLLSDAQLGDQDFNEFCTDLGYDTDSRRAHDQWKASQRMASRVRRFLGDDFDSFLYADR